MISPLAPFSREELSAWLDIYEIQDNTTFDWWLTAYNEYTPPDKFIDFVLKIRLEKLVESRLSLSGENE